MITILMNRMNLSAAINPVFGNYLFFAVRFFVAGRLKAKGGKPKKHFLLSLNLASTEN